LPGRKRIAPVGLRAAIGEQSKCLDISALPQALPLSPDLGHF
jgi:hypothetical protein